MVTGEESTPSKHSKSASSSQEVPSTPYQDWSNSMQAYYGAGGTPTHFFPSPVASPSPHPYMWGPQHPMMPHYGTPVPYPPMYPPGGVYAQSNMSMAPNTAPANTENIKEQGSNKKAKAGGSRGKGEKATSGSGIDGVSPSEESATEGSSDGKDEKEQGLSRKGSFKQMLADADSQNKAMDAVQGSSPLKPVVAPATNLNIGMDLWSSPAGGADERELKRQKRKQSNRESARRSRLRKQAECEQLQQRVESLNSENHGLREELQRLSEECEKLKTENNNIKDELTRFCGPEAVAKLEKTAKETVNSGNT